MCPSAPIDDHRDRDDLGSGFAQRLDGGHDSSRRSVDVSSTASTRRPVTSGPSIRSLQAVRLAFFAHHERVDGRVWWL